MARKHRNAIQNTWASKIYLIIFGLIFALVPLLSVIPIAFEDEVNSDGGTYEVVEAEISRIDRKKEFDKTYHYVYVEYEYAGKEYKDIQLNMYDSTMSEGKKIDIKVDVNNPKKIKATEIMGGPNYVILLAALPFLVIGIVLVIVGIKMKPQSKKGYGRYETPSQFNGGMDEANYRNNTYGSMNSQNNTYGSMNSQNNTYGSMNSQNNTYGSMNSQNNTYGSTDYYNEMYGNSDFDNFGNDALGYGNANNGGSYGGARKPVIKNNKELLKTGKRMTGVIEKIENNTDFRGDAYVKVYCTCFDVSSNTSYRYSSEDIPVSEGVDSTVLPGGMIDVYVNPDNLGEYYVSVPRERNVNVGPYTSTHTNTNINTNANTNTYDNAYTSTYDNTYTNSYDNAYSSLNTNTDVDTNVDSISNTTSINDETTINKNNGASQYASLDSYSKEKKTYKSIEEMYNSRNSL